MQIDHVDFAMLETSLSHDDTYDIPLGPLGTLMILHSCEMDNGFSKKEVQPQVHKK